MDFSSTYYDKTLGLLKQLCPIPAPSYDEGRRVDFICGYLEKEGIEGFYVDEAKNVIIPYNDDGKCELDVFAAHTDVVFPDTEELPMRIEGERLYCPGCGDDTANVAGLIMYAIHFIKERIKTKRGVLFVCNSCEEGLGNLYGVRTLFENYKGRISSFTSFDHCLGKGIVNVAVGSERYRIKVKTEGGHSYANFGNRNAIAILSEIITKLYRQTLPDSGKTTYNVGTISGGTSINSIAQEAECTYEFRSVDESALSKMRSSFDSIISSFKAKNNDVTAECIGLRPCSSGEADTTGMENLARTLMEKYGMKYTPGAGSTDCNIPLSLGIKAICLGLIYVKGSHTREEYVDLKSFSTGLNLGYDYIYELVSSEM